uniref:Uncharacterized protein n=1 Tax=Periophthalmus magnuspinnatus TaxID=409849 RepID=A0A3B3Z911_9GOBI
MTVVSLCRRIFVCSICLSVFVDPVSTPCGHNFCKSCICSYWDESSHCTCPLCKEDFNTRPQLKINTLLSHMASHSLKKPPKQEESCESRMCAEHHKPLELFCKTDNICVCTYCSFSDHKSHNIVPLGEECEERKAEVMKMLSVRKKKIEQIQTSLELSQKAANKVTTEGLEVFTALEQAVQKNLDNLIKEIQGKLEKTTKQNKDLIAELENQISELDHRSTEMEKPANSEDYLQFLKTFTPFKSDPNIKNCSMLSICQPSFKGPVVRSLLDLEKTFTEVLNRIYQADLKAKQKCEVDPKLSMKFGNKKCSYMWGRENVPIDPETFSVFPFVMGQQSFSSGSFYFEVQVTRKTQWALGVARESINRKDEITLSPSFGVWVILLQHSELLVCPSKGWCVDYEEGVVSFHDVDAAAPIYFFTGCCFNDKLRPFFVQGGGGVCALFRDNLVTHSLSFWVFSSFEYVSFKIL